jgi:hypothetical protein
MPDVFLAFLSCPGYPFLEVPFWLSSYGSTVLAALSCGPVLAILSWDLLSRQYLS